MYRNRKTNYVKMLLEQERRVFKISDLAVLWGMEKSSSLWMTVNRYKQRKILYPVQRGMYSVVSLEKLDPFELGCAVSGPFSYVSGETVLVKEGLIFQKVYKITLFGKKQKEFSLGGRDYLCRYLDHKYLVNRAGIKDEVRYSLASLERALADIWQVNPKYYIDNQKGFDKKKLKVMQKKIGYV